MCVHLILIVFPSHSFFVVCCLCTYVMYYALLDLEEIKVSIYLSLQQKCSFIVHF